MRKSKVLITSLLLIGCLVTTLFLAILPQSAWADVPAPDRTPLTIELLQKRLKSPTAIEGVKMIDLRRLTIDLRSENAAFREQFYRLIQTQLQQSNSPLGLDFSYAQILGELSIGDLGIRTALFDQTQFPNFSEAEQSQLARDRLRLSLLSQLSRSLLSQAPATAPLQITVLRGPLLLVQTRFDGFVNFTNTFFLNRVEAQGALFLQSADWSQTRFSQSASFSNAMFQQEARFRSALFFNRAKFNQTQFQGAVNFQSSEFQETAGFHQANFAQTANFMRAQWQNKADFAQTHWQGVAWFDRSRFNQALFLTEATFDRLASFRQARFNESVNLRGASILDQADFADADFAAKAYLNIPDLQFDPRRATILGDPGQVGRVLSVPTLQGNETLLRNLVQNFRQLQQIADANQIEYTTERLRLKQLRQRLLGTDLNTATTIQLRHVGFSPEQISAIEQARTQRPFRSLYDLLKLEGIDIGTYAKVSDRIIVGKPTSLASWLGAGWRWVGLGLLLLLSRYGTSSWLVLGVGLVAIAHFAVLFWLVDRVRKFHPQAILPPPTEMIWVLSGFGCIGLIGITAIFRTADHPWYSLGSIALLIIPLPALWLGLIYQSGRYHDLMDSSYFVEDGSMRQLRLLIGRLPNIPLFPFFRDRYTPILWDRRWSWLNYFDFSLNNFLKFGFNDIRLRDQHMPGLISTIVWYQWSLGMVYFALLLWTLSRTIPGLNLLIYFK